MTIGQLVKPSPLFGLLRLFIYLSPAELAATITAMTSTPYRVLARKYRPQTFTDLVGQEVLVRTLSNAFKTGRVAHAFLLTGIRGIGKTTTARIIARALNCIGPDGNGGMTIDPCGVCPNCKMIAEDRHVDVIEMDAASHTGVGDIRDLIETVHYAPTNARYKVYIIDEVHMLSNQRLQRAAEDAGGTAAPRHFHFRHHRTAKNSGDDLITLPAFLI